MTEYVTVTVVTIKKMGVHISSRPLIYTYNLLIHN